MAKWDSFIYTSTGLRMIADAVACNQIAFTRAVSSTDDHSADSDETIAKLTSIATEAQSVDVSRVTKLSDTEDKVYATFPTRTVTTAYKMRTVGLYAKLQSDSKETLFGVGISTEPDYVAAGAVDGTDANINLSFIIGVSSTNQVAITISSDGMVTEKELTDELTFKADDTQVVHDNHDGTITVNDKVYTPADSETVAQLRTDFDTLDVGGVNLIQGTSRIGLNVAVPDNHAEFLVKGLVDESLPHSQYYSCRIWFQLPDVDMYVGLHLAGNGGTETVTGNVVKAGTSGYSQIQVKMKDGQYPYESFVQTVGDVGGFYLTYKRYKVEAGTKPTDWSPAPDEMASKNDVTTGMNQANAYTDAGLKPKADDAKVIHNDSGYGAENLIRNSAYPIDTVGWTVSGPGATVNGNIFKTSTHSFYQNNTSDLFVVENISSSEMEVLSDPEYVSPGETLSWSFKAFSAANVVSSDVYLMFNESNAVPLMQGVRFDNSAVESHYGKLVVPAGMTSMRFRIDNNGSANTANANMYFTEVKVARESQPSPWSYPTVDLINQHGLRRDVDVSSNLTDLDDMLIGGYYSLRGGMTNWKNGPSSMQGTRNWGYLKIVSIGGLTFQEIHTITDRIFHRSRSGDPIMWGYWHEITTTVVKTIV